MNCAHCDVRLNRLLFCKKSDSVLVYYVNDDLFGSLTSRSFSLLCEKFIYFF